MQPNRFKAALAVALPGLAWAAALGAQDPGDAGQAALIEKRDKKLASEFLEKVDWMTDLAAAKKAAKESGKPIFAYFTRSYAP